MARKDGKKLFVCDFGFSALKWELEGKVGRFPSAYKQLGPRIVVGEAALMDGDSSDVQTTEDLVRLYPQFVEHAANQAGLSGKGYTLAVGLPFSTWKNEMAKSSSGQGSVIDVLGKSLTQGSFEKVVVLPQGLGGITAQISGGKVSSGNILGIDMGFNTVIVTLFSQETRGIIKDHTFFGKGVKELASNYLMPKIEHHIGQELNPVQISHLMEKGYIRQGFSKIDIRNEVKVAAKEYCTDLVQYLISYIKSKWSSAADFDTIVFFGGGSRLFQDVPSSSSLSIIVAEEPEYANSRGFAILANEGGE